MKKALAWIAVVCALIASAVGGVWYSAFSNNLPIEDGRTIVPGVATVKDGFVSVFILDVGPGKVALIDAGRHTSARSILAALAARGLDASSVVGIFLTHGHGDHTAGCKQFPRARIFAMENERELVGEAAAVTDALRDGAVAELGELRVEAFAVPGHTPGSVVYLAKGVLFFGDSAGANKEHEVMPAVRLFSKAPGENVSSLKRLAARLAPRAAEIQMLAFAHTGPLSGFEPLQRFAATTR